jgi:hypothetical protein
VAINFEDDLINPPELGILEREIGRVPKGKAILIPRVIGRGVTAPTRPRPTGKTT